MAKPTDLARQMAAAPLADVPATPKPRVPFTFVRFELNASPKSYPIDEKNPAAGSTTKLGSAVLHLAGFPDWEISASIYHAERIEQTAEGRYKIPETYASLPSGGRFRAIFSPKTPAATDARDAFLHDIAADYIAWAAKLAEADGNPAGTPRLVKSHRIVGERIAI